MKGELVRFSIVVMASGLVSVRLAAQQGGEVLLDPFVVEQVRVANTSPVGTYDMVVSGLRFEPLVDVESRNMAEGQADVSVRGGIFENTGFRVGGASLFDPQTGHYFAEIPVAPAMLTPVKVLTGYDSAFAGFNSTAATLSYEWSQIVPRGEATAGLGQFGLRRGEAYEAVPVGRIGDLDILGDMAVSYSQGDGAIAGGDHEFARYAGRLQFRRGSAQTDLFGGYQSKFFGWPNLYTPFGFMETENLKTTLFLINHRVQQGDGEFVEASALWRRNVDDYEYDRTHPGAGNPFQHETRVASASIEARHAVGDAAFLRGRAEVVGDSIDSTSLTFAGFDTRTYFKTSLTAEKEFGAATGEWFTRGGFSYDDDNRASARLSPLFEVAFTGREGRLRAYAQVSGSSQVPGYTALGSSSTAGLFRGNQMLDRERSTDWEIGVSSQNGDWVAQAAVFMRRDNGLTDWTFTKGVTARSANPVDIDTLGFEAVLTRKWPQGRVILGYTWLDKDPDYRGLAVDASFYALNFARHRATLALVWGPARWIEVRVDNEFRKQQPNVLRQGGDTAFITSLGVHLFPSSDRSLEVSVLVDNLWDEDFQEVPAVPAAPRQSVVMATYHW